VSHEAACVGVHQDEADLEQAVELGYRLVEAKGMETALLVVRNAALEVLEGAGDRGLGWVTAPEEGTFATTRLGLKETVVPEGIRVSSRAASAAARDMATMSIPCTTISSFMSMVPA